MDFSNNSKEMEWLFMRLLNSTIINFYEIYLLDNHLFVIWSLYNKQRGMKLIMNVIFFFQFRHGEWDDRVDDVSNKRRKKCGRLDAGSYRIRTISQIDKRTLDTTKGESKWKPFLQSSRLFRDIILCFVSFPREANSYPNGIDQTKKLPNSHRWH